jgi:hypothetical protein
LKDIRGSDTAVFIGICNNDYDAILRENIVKLSVDENSTDQISTAVGAVAYSTYAFASNRVSHMFGMMGASISLDCASASGLVAVHMAILNSRSKTTQNIDKVDKTPLLQASSSIAGSVNLILHSQLLLICTLRAKCFQMMVGARHLIQERMALKEEKELELSFCSKISRKKETFSV